MARRERSLSPVVQSIPDEYRYLKMLKIENEGERQLEFRSHREGELYHEWKQQYLDRKGSEAVLS